MRRSNGQNGKEKCLLLVVACLLGCSLDLRGEGCSNIYYYTPLPLNLANKQASNKQARHHSVLAIAPSPRLGLDSTLAILEPRWCPCQIQLLSPKLTGGGLERGRQDGSRPPTTAHLVPQNSLFWPKTAQIPNQNGPTRQTVATLHVRLNCPVIKSPFLPSSSTICPRNGPNVAKNGLNVRCLCQTRPKPRTGCILGYVAQNRIPRPPTFGGFQALESPNETPRPSYKWSLGGAGG